MSLLETSSLAGVAGATIFIGLPVARLQGLAPRWRAGLAAVSAGVVLFLLMEILSHAIEPVEEALKAASEGGSVAEFAVRAASLVGGVAAGLLSVSYLSLRLGGDVGRGSSARHLAAGTAAGLGLHNFAEGLAIGQSAATGATTLALILVIGFALHNGTEGFAIAAPFGLGDRPSWRLLALLGVIGGGPTFVGGMAGYAFVSPILSIVFLSLAAGALVWVFVEVTAATRRLATPTLAGAALVFGFFAALGTDFFLELAGG
jgi:ZIP family zinc transporter